MTTDHDPRTPIVLSWLREDAHENAERVLLGALDEVDTTPQRRSRGPAWRSNRMNTYVKLIAAAAAVLVVAVVGYQFLPASGGVGGQPTIAPSPSPALLASGSFTVPVANATELDATGDGANVTGTMTVAADDGSITVDLECTRTTEGGLIVIAGTVSDSTMDAFSSGSRFGIILERGSPVKAGFMFDETKPEVTCVDFLEGPIDVQAGPGLKPIEGTVQLGP